MVILIKFASHSSIVIKVLLIKLLLTSILLLIKIFTKMSTYYYLIILKYNYRNIKIAHSNELPVEKQSF